jgi:hypothetical protein
MSGHKKTKRMLSYRPGDLSSALGGEGEEEALISSLFSSPYEVGPRAEYSAANKGSGTPPESRPPGRKPRKKRKEPSTGGAVLPEEEAVDEKEARTIFVGNLPVGMRADRIKRLFKAYGTVESVRLRSVAVEGTKVGDHGNQNLVRKVCIMQKKIRADVKDSTNAYVVFETAEAASAAKEQGNGTEVEASQVASFLLVKQSLNPPVLSALRGGTFAWIAPPLPLTPHFLFLWEIYLSTPKMKSYGSILLVTWKVMKQAECGGSGECRGGGTNFESVLNRSPARPSD